MIQNYIIVKMTRKWHVRQNANHNYIISFVDRNTFILTQIHRAEGVRVDLDLCIYSSHTHILKTEQIKNKGKNEFFF